MGAQTSRGPEPLSRRPPPSAARLLPTDGSKDVWGPRWWDYFHQRSIYWPRNPSPRQVYDEHVFLQTFFGALPCPDCSGHALEYYWRNYPDLRSNEKYHAWAFTFHNSVNARLGKPQLNYSEYQELYRRHLLANNLV